MLAGRDPAEIALKSGVRFDGAAFYIESLARTYRFDYPGYSCTEPMSEWLYLIVMHYLHFG